ncbi:MAG: hypothetical protein KY469_13185 [Actinobacteria bacterium]|nr:hypothetical protein [Actinomycetota bacterium]
MATRTRPGGSQSLTVVSGLAVLVCVAGTGLVILAERLRDGPIAEFGVVWMALLAASCLVERYPLVLHVRGESHSFLLTELPLVAGLFLIGPLEVVVARLGGGLLAMLVDRRQPIKLVFNLSTYTLEAGILLGVFWAVVGPATGTPPVDPSIEALAAAFVGTVTAALSGSGCVWLAISVSNGTFDRRVLRDVFRLAFPMAVATTAIALIAVLVVVLRPEAAVILTVPVVLLAKGYKRYLDERADRQVLGMLYTLARDTQASQDLDGILAAVARTLRTHTRADTLELYLRRSGGNTWSMTVGADDQVSPLIRVADVPDALADSLEEGAPVRTLDQRGRCTAITHALALGQGRYIAFVARDPLSDVDGFRDEEMTVLAAVASHARAVIEDAELRQAKDAFLSSVSHELRTPLAVVLAASETLHRRFADLPTEVSEQLIGRLDAQARRLDALLGDLLDVERLGRGMIGPRYVPTELHALLRRAVARLEITSHEVNVDADVVAASVDPAACERIIDNLVLNAVKYAPTGTRIDVVLRAVPGALVLSVQDEGPGVPDEDKERVFEAFLRLDPSHPSPGTGVGLALVQRLVHLHGGSVRVEDTPLGGARFVVRLPRTEIAEGGHEGSVEGQLLSGWHGAAIETASVGLQRPTANARG